MLHDILLVVIGLIIGLVIGFFVARYFMKKYIFDVYNSKYILVYRKEISTLINNKIFEEIYLKKLDNITKKINSDLYFCKIKHLTIVVIGRCGVGKSTLI